MKGTALTGIKTGRGAEIQTVPGEIYTSKMVLFASGIADQLPLVKGFQNVGEFLFCIALIAMGTR